MDSSNDETIASAKRTSRRTDPSAPKVVANRYRIIRLVGKGAMGEVYEAEDLELRERIALKTIRPELARDLRAAERFRREILLARSITHPNACRIFDMGRHEEPTGGSMLFLTMELLDGETLMDRVRREGPMTPEQALPIVRQIASAMDAAHAAGVVHRDLKSSNIVLDMVTMRPEPDEPEPPPELRVVVTDFGLARRVDGMDGDQSLTGAFEWVGTPANVAPEQVEGAPVTEAVDVYAFGVLLYEMATGAWPFEGATPQDTAVKRLTEPPIPPSRRRAVDPAWEAAILRCLERSPSARYASCGDVVAALEGAEEAAPEAASPSSTASRAPKWKWALYVAGLVVAIAALVQGAMVVMDRNGTGTFEGTAVPPLAAPTFVVVRADEASSADSLGQAAPGDWLSVAVRDMVGHVLGEGGEAPAAGGPLVRTKATLEGEGDAQGVNLTLEYHATPGDAPVVVTDSAPIAELVALVDRLTAKLLETAGLPPSAIDADRAAALSTLAARALVLESTKSLDAGRVADALRLAERALAPFAATGTAAEADVRQAKARALAEMGRLEDAAKELEREVELLAGDPVSSVEALSDLALIRVAQGFLDAARAALARADALSAEHHSDALERARGVIALVSGDVASARAAVDRLEAPAGTLQARVALAEGDLAKAEAAARAEADAARAADRPTREAIARALLAQVLVAQRRLPDAQVALAEAEQALARTESWRARMAVATVALRVAVASGSGAGARAAALNELGKDLETSGRYVQLDTWEAALALAESHRRVQRRRADETLETIAKGARERGFDDLANRAEHARGR